MTPPPSILETVSRRRDLLSALESAPRDKPGLVAALESSRSTVDRAIRELEAHSLVARRDGGFALSVAGRLALAEYRRSLETLETIGDAGYFLEFVPSDAPMSVAVLEGATIHEPSPHAPNEPLEEIARLLDGACRFRGLVAAERLPQFRTLVYDGTVHGDLDAEMVLTEDLLSYLCANRSEELRETMATGQFRIHATTSIPYGLGIIERSSSAHVFVVTTDAGDPTAVIHNDSEDALEWATAVYHRYRRAASRIESPGPGPSAPRRDDGPGRS